MYKGTIEIKAKVDMKVKVPVEVNRVSDMYEEEEFYNKLYHDDKDKFLSEAEVVGVDIDETGWELN
ncbi:MAG: hypothetical protein E7G23_08880 [Streptococcus mitis]|jgi:hypothetical protein|uniref:Uncharacterized protein n=4 Tax=Viruses TaxID=10239 RepID=A0A1W6JP81_9CAUD|nr:hypothetical protein [Staphylococcus epidermidis]YP_009302073.1 transcriptional regulator [Staphylococcus phage CNPx]YP_010083003.1 transcriptional regulator [Staphylococcus phage IME1348_01]YP_950717.1 transcriptional regulator [Staphylococcus phage PH15]MDU1260048.1 transcriptional regulator [Staphylococcus warneri]MDU1965509.1 transcriptional regulator [Staphylococcus lugdunensis]MDU3714074.1 hypothetical protein [Streptococcus mitis]MDU7037835.1 hypothetical protein [Lactococcus lacti